MSAPADLVAYLLDEMEEYYGAFDHFPLYQLMWTLRGQSDLSGADMRAVAERAYDEFRERHPVRLVWVPWPIDLDQARPVEPGTPLDFDLDPDESVETPLLALVAADS